MDGQDRPKNREVLGREDMSLPLYQDGDSSIDTTDVGFHGESGQDWEGVLTLICDRLREIQLYPAVRDDLVIQRIFRDMRYVKGFEDLCVKIDELGARVAQILTDIELGAHNILSKAASSTSIVQKTPIGRITLRL